MHRNNYHCPTVALMRMQSLHAFLPFQVEYLLGTLPKIINRCSIQGKKRTCCLNPPTEQSFQAKPNILIYFRHRTCVRLVA